MEVEEAMTELIELIAKTVSIGRYKFFDYWDYEDEYSHNEIDEFQRNFKEVAELYLNEHYPNQFKIVYGAEVLILVPQE